RTARLVEVALLLLVVEYAGVAAARLPAGAAELLGAQRPGRLVRHAGCGALPEPVSAEGAGTGVVEGAGEAAQVALIVVGLQPRARRVDQAAEGIAAVGEGATLVQCAAAERTERAQHGAGLAETVAGRAAGLGRCAAVPADQSARAAQGDIGGHDRGRLAA